MAERGLTDTGATASASGATLAGALARPAVRVAIVYLAARVLTSGFLMLASMLSPEGSRFGRGASLATYVLAWDAQWYWLIAVEGYPTDLPRDDNGDVVQNAWAFMPVFPVLARLVGAPFGSWAVGAFLIALVAGYLCCLVLYRMFAERLGGTAATWSVVFVAAGPLALLFQVGYAESLFLLLILLGIRLLERRRYLPLYPLVLAMAYVRPGVLAFALLVGLVGLWRWFSRSRDPLSAGEIAHILGVGALATAAGLSWPLIAGAVTGDPTGYLETELSWRRLWLGDAGAFVPFEGWIQAAQFWFGATWRVGEIWGYVALAAIVVGSAALLLFEPHVRRLGVVPRLWAASYLLYLFAVFFPQSSVFRLLFPLAPLFGALAVPRSTAWRLAVLGACLLGQWWWIWNMYGIGSNFWQIP